MLHRFVRLPFAALLLLSAGLALAQDARNYTEGAVTVVSAIRTKPGMFDEYMKYLGTTYKQVMEEDKKTGNILSYSFYAASPRTPHDPDLYLTITYKNWGAFDGLADRSDATTKKVWGSLSQSAKAEIDREKLREVLGTEVIQELKLK